MVSVNVAVIGTGEYVTGLVSGQPSRSDKAPGVIALTLFDLRRRGLVDRILLAGRDGRRFLAIRRHLQEMIANRYAGLDITTETFPSDECKDPRAYSAAIRSLPPGSVVIVATPDETHDEIAMEALRRDHHVLVLKPLTKTVVAHAKLIAEGCSRGLLIAADYHKRFDPIYLDARDRIRTLGDMSLMLSYMSQPKHQLGTFRAWAGLQSDISYYLNAHHIDFHCWALAGIARPVHVQATAATGVAREILDRPIEDAITLTVGWENLRSRTQGVAVYTASWIAPLSDVHSQQRFFYMGACGEVCVDQAHRGYSSATDIAGYASLNPLFMKYTPTDGRFTGQSGYGYRSIEAFIEAAGAISSSTARPADYDATLATASATRTTTAVLEAGRRSLDAGGRRVILDRDGEVTAVCA